MLNNLKIGIHTQLRLLLTFKIYFVLEEKIENGQMAQVVKRLLLVREVWGSLKRNWLTPALFAIKYTTFACLSWPQPSFSSSYSILIIRRGVFLASFAVTDLSTSFTSLYFSGSSVNTAHLVFFEAAINHVIRAARAFRQPGTHMLLVGIDGTGKSTTCKLATRIAGCQLYRLVMLLSVNT